MVSSLLRTEWITTYETHSSNSEVVMLISNFTLCKRLNLNEGPQQSLITSRPSLWKSYYTAGENYAVRAILEMNIWTETDVRIRTLFWISEYFSEAFDISRTRHDKPSVKRSLKLLRAVIWSQMENWPEVGPKIMDSRRFGHKEVNVSTHQI